MAGEDRRGGGGGSTIEGFGEKLSILEVKAQDLGTAYKRGIDPHKIGSVERVLSPGDSSQSIAQELGEEESISVLSKTHHTSHRLQQLEGSRVGREEDRRKACVKALIKTKKERKEFLVSREEEEEKHEDKLFSGRTNGLVALCHSKVSAKDGDNPIR